MGLRKSTTKSLPKREVKSNFMIKIEPSLKKEFMDMCNLMDTTASREIRSAMRKFIKDSKRKLEI